MPFEYTEHEKKYLSTWGELVFLLLFSVCFSYLMIPHHLAVALIFGVSILKASLVVRHFMHLNKEASVVFIAAATPFLLLAILLSLLWPDFGHHGTQLALLVK